MGKILSVFSNHETDEEYVQYWGELFKKIKVCMKKLRNML
jgi:hypothetical protein